MRVRVSFTIMYEARFPAMAEYYFVFARYARLFSRFPKERSEFNIWSRTTVLYTHTLIYNMYTAVAIAHIPRSRYVPTAHLHFPNPAVGITLYRYTYKYIIMV